MSEQSSRRNFLISSSGLIVATGCGGQDSTGGGTTNEPIGDPDYYPNTSREPSPPTDGDMPRCASTAGLMVGPVAATVGVNQIFPVSGNIWCGRDQNKLFAISVVCQHLGCTYSSLSIDPNSLDWYCRCHGSRYGFDGALINGPAAKPLPRYYVCEGSDGKLYIDTTKMI
jgi:Rieske Fe-S protein